jgi:2-aminoadipate transaminase
VLCGLPSYLGGLNTFTTYGAKLKGITMDKSGIKPDELEETIITLTELERKIKFIYVIPDFQNPAGITMPDSRRIEIIDLAEKYDLLIIEDSPYREVRFEGKPQKLMYELDATRRVITLCSFSKIFVPGFRVGWAIGHPEIIDKIAMAKQTADLCTSPFIQKIIAKYMEKGLLEINLKKTIALYRERRSVMVNCLYKYMPKEVTWTEPEGGLFLFVTLPASINADNIFKNAIDKNVAFVAGSTFYCNDSGKNTMRLNFSYSNNIEIETGISRLALVISEEIKNK